MNLHSTMVLLKSTINNPRATTPSTSTFHYGSIKIRVWHRKWTDCIRSTFHYGSIKIYNNISLRKIKDDLHSTMVLLK